MNLFPPCEHKSRELVKIISGGKQILHVHNSVGEKRNYELSNREHMSGV